MTQMTAAEKFRQSRNVSKPAEIAEVICPECGSVALFEKPSKFGMVFGMGTLPQQAASDAVEAWQEEGVMKVPDTTAPADQSELMKTVFGLRDKVLKLSRTPKLVVGTANEANGEMSTDDAPDCCLDTWFKWVAAGGDASVMLAMFPAGQRPDAMASRSRRKVRTKAK